MTDRADPSPAFRALRGALTRRRLDQIEPLLRVELALLAALVMGFVFWQTRVPLDGLARAGGWPAVAGRLAALLGALALLGVPAVAGRHATQLARGPAGPAWLALPIPSRALERHFAWDARAAMGFTAPPALAMIAAAWGLAPVWVIALAALGYLATAWSLALLTTTVVFRLSAARAPRRAGADALVCVLAEASGAVRSATRPGVRWTRRPAWRALWEKDLRITRAPSAARARAWAPLAFGAASVAMWWLPVEPLALRRALAFALALLAAGTLAEWLVALSGSDPFAALRVLPIGVGTMWTARAASALVFVAALVLAHTAGAGALPEGARGVFVVWTASAALAIAALGVNYGLTLFPHADRARRMLTLTLAIAMAASFMLPLSGWVLLFAAVIHSTRRLSRWERLEESD